MRKPRLWLWVVGAALFAVVAVIAVIFGPGWLVWGQQIGATDELTTAEASIATASARQAILLAAGGLIALVGVVVSLFRNFRENDQAGREAAHASLERDQHWTQR